FKYIILPLQAKEEGKLVHRKIRSETKTVAGMLIEEESFLVELFICPKEDVVINNISKITTCLIFSIL
ncbi:MAG: hypothetical protein ACPGVH_07350, partial [Chitinophagales bacterium]